MAPQRNAKALTADKKVARINSGTSKTNSKKNDKFRTMEQFEQFLVEKIAEANQEAAAKNEIKTSKREPNVAKAENWDPTKKLHVELLEQLQGHFGQGSMKKYVVTKQPNKIFFEYEEKFLAEILTKHPHDDESRNHHRPLKLPIAIAIVFMKLRKEKMAGFDNGEIKLDYTDRQIRDKLVRMWALKVAQPNQNQQPTSTACLQMEDAAGISEEMKENNIQVTSTDVVDFIEVDMNPQEELLNDEPMEVEKGEDSFAINPAMSAEVNHDEPMEDEENEDKEKDDKRIGRDTVEPIKIDTSKADTGVNEHQKLRDLTCKLQNRFEQWWKRRENEMKPEKVEKRERGELLKAQFKREKIEKFLQGKWMSASSPTELLARIHESLKNFSETERNGLLEIMEEFNLCCGNHQFTTREPLKCDGSTKTKECMIQPLENYESFEFGQQTFNFCMAHLKKCESQRKLNAVDSSAVSKRFCNVENVEKCNTCEKYYHNSCRRAGLLEERNCQCGETDEEFTSPLALPETEESKFIQEKVKEHEIFIRSFSTKLLTEELEGDENEEKHIKKMRKTILDYFSKNGRELSLSYENKLILAFKKTKKNYILFFAMMAREYGKNAPPSKAGQISLDYVDSLQYLKNTVRSVIYHKILNSYMEFSKTRGFSMTTFWACPPSDGEQYLFGSRPVQQHAINLSQLLSFYKKMIKNAGNTIEGVKYGTATGGLKNPIEMIEHAISNNSRSFTIISKSIEKANKMPNPKLKDILEEVTKKEGEKEIFNLRLLEKPAEEIISNDPANISEIAESSEYFQQIQEEENMEFGVKSLNVFSTSKMVDHLLKSLEQKSASPLTPLEWSNTSKTTTSSLVIASEPLKCSTLSSSTKTTPSAGNATGKSQSPKLLQCHCLVSKTVPCYQELQGSLQEARAVCRTYQRWKRSAAKYMTVTPELLLTGDMDGRGVVHIAKFKLLQVSLQPQNFSETSSNCESTGMTKEVLSNRQRRLSYKLRFIRLCLKVRLRQI
ncbi:unnamed protein product [Caenorhabditis brenneri]